MQHVLCDCDDEVDRHLTELQHKVEHPAGFARKTYQPCKIFACKKAAETCQ